MGNGWRTFWVLIGSCGLAGLMIWAFRNLIRARNATDEVEKVRRVVNGAAQHFYAKTGMPMEVVESGNTFVYSSQRWRISAVAVCPSSGLRFHLWATQEELLCLDLAYAPTRVIPGDRVNAEQDVHRIISGLTCPLNAGWVRVIPQLDRSAISIEHVESTERIADDLIRYLNRYRIIKAALEPRIRQLIVAHVALDRAQTGVAVARDFITREVRQQLMATGHPVPPPHAKA
jgi:hypothetical protein